MFKGRLHGLSVDDFAPPGPARDVPKWSDDTCLLTTPAGDQGDFARVLCASDWMSNDFLSFDPVILGRVMKLAPREKRREGDGQPAAGEGRAVAPTPREFFATALGTTRKRPTRGPPKSARGPPKTARPSHTARDAWDRAIRAPKTARPTQKPGPAHSPLPKPRRQVGFAQTARPAIKTDRDIFSHPLALATARGENELFAALQPGKAHRTRISKVLSVRPSSSSPPLSLPPPLPALGAVSAATLNAVLELKRARVSPDHIDYRESRDYIERIGMNGTDVEISVKVYAQTAFAFVRKTFHIAQMAFTQSLPADSRPAEGIGLGPGLDGKGQFYISKDKSRLIRVIDQTEVTLFIHHLPTYLKAVLKGDVQLPRVLGMYKLQCKHPEHKGKWYIAVTENAVTFPLNLPDFVWGYVGNPQTRVQSSAMPAVVYQTALGGRDILKIMDKNKELLNAAMARAEKERSHLGPMREGNFELNSKEYLFSLRFNRLLYGRLLPDKDNARIEWYGAVALDRLSEVYVKDGSLHIEPQPGDPPVVLKAPKQQCAAWEADIKETVKCLEQNAIDGRPPAPPIKVTFVEETNFDTPPPPDTGPHRAPSQPSPFAPAPPPLLTVAPDHSPVFRKGPLMMLTGAGRFECLYLTLQRQRLRAYDYLKTRALFELRLTTATTVTLLPMLKNGFEVDNGMEAFTLSAPKLNLTRAWCRDILRCTERQEKPSHIDISTPRTARSNAGPERLPSAVESEKSDMERGASDMERGASDMERKGSTGSKGSHGSRGSPTTPRGYRGDRSPVQPPETSGGALSPPGAPSLAPKPPSPNRGRRRLRSLSPLPIAAMGSPSSPEATSPSSATPPRPGALTPRKRSPSLPTAPDRPRQLSPARSPSPSHPVASVHFADSPSPHSPPIAAGIRMARSPSVPIPHDSGPPPAGPLTPPSMGSGPWPPRSSSVPQVVTPSPASPPSALVSPKKSSLWKFGRKKSSGAPTPPQGVNTNKGDGIKGLTLYAYAAANFKKNHKPDSAIAWQSDLLKHPLHSSLHSGPQREAALHAHQCIREFCGEAKTERLADAIARDLVATALQGGDEVHAEVLCLLCKHAIYNPNPTSLTSVWKLSVLVCGVLVPPPTLLPALQSFLESMFEGHEQLTVPTEASKSVGRSALMALRRLEACVAGTRREYEPSQLEISSLLMCKPVPLRIQLLDGSSLPLPSLPSPTPLDVWDRVGGRLHIPPDMRTSFVLCVQDGDNFHPLADSTLLFDVMGSHEKEGSPAPVFAFVCGCYHPLFEDVRYPTCLRLWAAQVLHFVVRGLYVVEPDIAVEIAALQLYSLMGPFSENVRHRVNALLPTVLQPSLPLHFPGGKWVDRVCQAWTRTTSALHQSEGQAANSDVDLAEPRLMLLQLARRARRYGAIFYRAEYESVQCLVGISPKSLHVVNPAASLEHDVFEWALSDVRIGASDLPRAFRVIIGNSVFHFTTDHREALEVLLAAQQASA